MKKPILYRRISLTLYLLGVLFLCMSTISSLLFFLFVVSVITALLISVFTWVCPNCKSPLPFRVSSLDKGTYCPYCGHNIKA